LTEQLTDVRQQLAAEAIANNAAVSAAHALQQELTALRVGSARQLEAVRQEQSWTTGQHRRA